MRKTRVVFFAEILISDFDGASRTMFQLFNRIDPARFEFLFICASGPDQLHGFECFKVPAVPIPFNSKYVIGLPGLAAGRVRERVDAFRPDVVHIATPSFLGHFGLKYARERALPVISIYHTHFISYMSYYFRFVPFLIKTMEKAVQDKQNAFYNQCNLVYIPSTSIANELVGMGLQQERIKIWKRGMDTSLFSPAKKDEAYLRNLTGNALPTVLFASRLVWEKNLETLIRIYEILEEQQIACNFVVVGDGVAAKDCRQRMPNAIFPGHLGHKQLSVLYASASVFVFPSVSETFGNVVLEAMASGLVPVIADGGGSRDFIDNGVNGFKCAPDDAACYVRDIRKVLEDTRLRASLSVAAVKYSQSYDWNELADTYFEDLTALAKHTEQIDFEN
jgi:glycosyltransferase involved in cell wall biosynthesis